MFRKYIFEFQYAPGNLSLYVLEEFMSQIWADNVDILLYALLI